MGDLGNGLGDKLLLDVRGSPADVVSRRQTGMGELASGVRTIRPPGECPGPHLAYRDAVLMRSGTGLRLACVGEPSERIGRHLHLREPGLCKTHGKAYRVDRVVGVADMACLVLGTVKAVAGDERAARA